MTRSTAAFKFSAEWLCQQKQCYFWTLTFHECPESDDWAMHQFHLFRTKLTRRFKALRGVRVIEWHKTRGIHFHFIVDVRIPIDLLFKLSMPLGFGRTGVRKVDEGTVAYLANYFDFSRENECGKRRRLWGRIGKWPNTRCRDVVFDTPFTRSYEFLKRFENIPAAKILYLKRLCQSFGEVGNWPEVVRKQWANKLFKSDKVYALVNGEPELVSVRTPLRGDAYICGRV
jgi:hypothetical protein